MPAASSARLCPVSRMTASTCSAAIRASPGGGLVEQQDVARGLAADLAAGFAQHAEHVAIADLGAPELDALLAQRHLEAEVAHHRPDHGSLEQPGALARGRDDVDELIAVDDAAQAVDHDEPIAIAIERDARRRRARRAR